MKIEKCVLTGYEIKQFNNNNSNPLIIKYECDYSGKVEITHQAYLTLSENSQANWELAGINLHNTLNKKEQITINSELINNYQNNYLLPKEFEEKSFLTLKGLYLLIGKENKTITQGIAKYSALGYTKGDEFKRILDQLLSKNYIDCKNRQRMSAGRIMYIGVTVTEMGKREAKKMLPNIPMISLVDNSINTGSSEIDIKLNYAKDLFLKTPSSMENMRSACEQLSFILEPLRGELQEYFSSKDVADFFLIVNKFDIRHNKDSTKNLKHPEQLEWVFYTLLNSISTYYKMKERIRSSS